MLLSHGQRTSVEEMFYPVQLAAQSGVLLLKTLGKYKQVGEISLIG